MRKILICLCLFLCFILTACKEEKNVASNRVYFFSQPGCIHCEHAKAYLSRYYKNYDIKELNIREGKNMGYMLSFARHFKVPEQTLGTPFIVLGQNYVMGWGEEQQRQFNRYIRQFKPKTAKK
jgi:glutaredoxin